MGNKPYYNEFKKIASNLISDFSYLVYENKWEIRRYVTIAKWYKNWKIIYIAHDIRQTGTNRGVGYSSDTYSGIYVPINNKSNFNCDISSKGIGDLIKHFFSSKKALTGNKAFDKNFNIKSNDLSKALEMVKSEKPKQLLINHINYKLAVEKKARIIENKKFTDQNLLYIEVNNDWIIEEKLIKEIYNVICTILDELSKTLVSKYNPLEK
ncbi:MAG: hypothetical protein KAT68_11655 [Bacteroidales bacterium]|nr:hypothetical protein [Bacteroidales bacterium]